MPKFANISFVSILELSKYINPMRISRKSKIAFQILLDVAAHTAAGRAISIPHISRRHSLSHSYLDLIFSQLKAAGLIKSHRGPGGGYSLAKKPEDISFYDVKCFMEKEETVRQDLGVFLWEDLEKHMKIQMLGINLSNTLKKSSINIDADAKVISFVKPSIKLPKISIPKKSKKVSNNNKKILGPNSVFAFGNYLKGI
jgi:Rrf2 family iron-sulfur cluster assembly transcriptional regulator